ncbi:MAG: hypothetical protein ACRBFS_03310 [Aureispira sp.]
MGKIGSFKPSYEQCHTLSIKSFTPSKSFALNKNFSGTLEVSNYWELTENTLFFKYKAATQLLELCFFRKGERYNQEIGIAQLETNLKNGYRFYFVCPHTRKRCTKLLRPFGNGVFLHRTAWKGLYYEKQKESKHYRAIANSRSGLMCKIDGLSWELYVERPKYQKTHYRGKPTPKYKRLHQLKEKCLRANDDVFRSFLGIG